MLSRIEKAAVLTAASSAAYFFSVFAAIGIQIHFPQIVALNERWNMSTNEPAVPLALLVGGFLIFGVVLLLFSPRIGIGAVARGLAFGTILGGVLGVAGWALRSFVGVGLWYLFHVFHLTPI